MSATSAPPSPPAPAAIMLSGRTIAGMLDISYRHWLRLVDAGKAPAPVRLGAVVRWNRDVITRWIADGCPRVRKGGR